MQWNYESWLKQAQDRLEDLLRQQDAIGQEIEHLKRGIEGFTALTKNYAPWEAVTIGITEAVKRVFTDSPNKCLRPTDIRDALLSKRDVKLDQRNPLATIHEIVSRLEERGFIQRLVEDGRARYYYIPPDVDPPPKPIPSRIPKKRRALASERPAKQEGNS
jgi:hypothetical protein